MKKIAFLLLFMLSWELHAQTCNSCTISGNNTIPINGSGNYSVSVGSGHSFFWSTVGNLNISGSNTGSSVSVQATGTGSGKVCVTTFKQGSEPSCCCKTLQLTANTCPTGVFIQPLFGPENGSPFCPNANYQFHAELTPVGATGATSWTWTLPPDWSYQSQGNTSFSSTLLSVTGTNQYNYLTVTATVPGCPAVTGHLYPEVNSSCNGGGFGFSIYPNPTKGEINIDCEGCGSEFYTVQLYNSKGVKLSETGMSNGKATLSLKLIEKTDQVFVRVIDKKGVSVAKQIQIER